MKRISIILHTQEFEQMVGCFGMGCMVFDFGSIDANYADAALIFTTYCEYIGDYHDKYPKYRKFSILFYILYEFSLSLIHLFIGSATSKKKVNMFSTAISPSVSFSAWTKEGFVHQLGSIKQSKINILKLYIKM
jgi:hypothetical protein